MAYFSRWAMQQAPKDPNFTAKQTHRLIAKVRPGAPRHRSPCAISAGFSRSAIYPPSRRRPCQCKLAGVRIAANGGRHK